MGFATRRHINWKNFWTCIAVAMSQFAFGYPGSIIGTTLGQPAFLEYMHLIDDEGNVTARANDLIGATSGVFHVFIFT